MQQLAGAEGAGLYRVVCGKAGQHLPCQRAPLGSFCFVHILCRFQQAAGHDGRRGGIPGFAAFRGKEHIPAGDHILRQAGKVKRQCFAEHIQKLFIVGVGVANGAAVHAPRLSPCPEAVILIALTGAAALGGAVRVHKEGVVGAAVRPEGVCQRSGGVGGGDLAVVVAAGHLRCPVQQRHVEHAVNDIAVVVGVVHSAPCLQEAAAGLVAGQQLVGGGNGGIFALFAAHQLPRCHAGGAVQKAHIVVVHLHLAGNAVRKAVHLNEGGGLEFFLPGGFVGQPDFPRPEAAGPLVIGTAGVDIVHAGMVLALVGVQGQIGLHLFAGIGQCLPCLGVGHSVVLVGFHHDYSLNPNVGISAHRWRRKCIPSLGRRSRVNRPFLLPSTRMGPCTVS